MNYDDKNTQKDSLAALRAETLGFSMMPLGILPNLGLEPAVAEEEVLKTSTAPSPAPVMRPKSDTGFSVARWFRIRFHRLKRAVS